MIYMATCLSYPGDFEPCLSSRNQLAISDIVVVRPRPSGAAALPHGRLLSKPPKVSPSLSNT